MGRGAIVAGNSSGGISALWCAAGYLRQRVPISETRERTVPEWFVAFVSRRIRAF